MTNINEHLKTHAATDANAFKAVARTWAATVTVCVARRAPEHITLEKPEIDAFTATSFQTVSIDPPLILVSVTTRSSAFELLREASHFSVNLLNPEHAELAGMFARSLEERKGAWEKVAFSKDAHGVPLFDGITGAFSATPAQFVDAGDHTLVLGAVTAIHQGTLEDTLIYHNRAYGRVRRYE